MPTPSHSRTPNDRVDVEALIADLEEFAKLRSLPWDWELAQYSKCRRSQAPDRRGLQYYSDLLLVLVKHAPKCLPPHKSIQVTWVELQARYGIKNSSLSTQSVATWADQAADAVRVALKHVLDLARSKTSFMPAALRQLVDKVDISRSTPEPVTTEKPVRAPRQLQMRDSDSSCAAELVSFVCRCPRCLKAEEILSSQEDPPVACGRASPVRSETSLAAEENSESVPATRGGHRKHVQKQLIKKPSASDTPATI